MSKALRGDKRREERQNAEEGGLGEETGDDEGAKERGRFPVMLSARPAASHMNFLSVNQLPHRPEDDGFYHLKVGKNTKREETARANWLWGQSWLRAFHTSSLSPSQGCEAALTSLFFR